MHTNNATGWFPESEHAESLDLLLSSANYSGEYPWDETDKPPVVRWADFEPIVKQKVQRIERSDKLKKYYWGPDYFPWNIAKRLGVTWSDPNQGSLGTCAGFAANSAARCALLTHKADGVELEYIETNPYPAWVLGREDANYRGGGASMSMVLNGINRYGRFPVSKVGSYEESIKSKTNWRNKISDAEPFQAGCSYLGNLSSREMFDSIVLCLKAGFPVAFGGSTRVDNTPVYKNGIKTGTLKGSWAHATAFVAYRLESDGSEYIAHLNSWGNCYGVGKYETDPGSVIWLSPENVFAMCSGRYRDAFVITYVESTPANVNWNFSTLTVMS